MAFQEVGGVKRFKAYKDMEPGEVVAEGWYLGESKGNYMHPNYDVKDKDTGETVCANGCGTLKKKMEEAKVIPGDYVRIEYHGTDIMKKGTFRGKEAHNIRLFVDKTLFDESYGANVEAPPSTEKPKPASKKPNFSEVEEVKQAPSRKSFAETLEEDDEEDLVF